MVDKIKQISLGNLLTIIALLITLIGWVFVGVVNQTKLDNKCSENEKRITEIENKIENNYQTLNEEKLDKEVFEVYMQVLNEIKMDVKELRKAIN